MPELLVEYELSSSPPPQRNDGLVVPRLATEEAKPTLAVRTGLRAGDGVHDVLNAKNTIDKKGATKSHGSMLGSQHSLKRRNKKDEGETAAKFDNEVDLLASAQSSPRMHSRQGGSSKGRVGSVESKKDEDGTLHFSSQQARAHVNT